MADVQDYRPIAGRFATVAQEFCSAVDSSSTTDRIEFLVKIYRILPRLIGEAVELPAADLSDPDEDSEPRASERDIRLTHAQWAQLYERLKEKLGDWDLYMQVFDPTKDKEPVVGSLADDLADIYRDLNTGLSLRLHDKALPQDIIWDWRFHFYSHWGPHAMQALQTIHYRLQDILE